MSKKSKGVVLDSTTPYGIGVHEDAKARLKYQSLMQDYEELHKETNVMRSKLDGSKDRKLVLAAEVRFLRKRLNFLLKMKNAHLTEQNLVQAPKSVKRAKIIKEQPLIRKEASQHRLPFAPEPISRKKQVALPNAYPGINDRKKKAYSRKEAKGYGVPMMSPPMSDLNQRKVLHIRKEVVAANTTPILDRNLKERMFGANDVTLRNPAVAFDLNLETSPIEEESSLPTRAPIFDLNEISTGDEDFVEANKLDDSRKSLIRGINEEQQNDLKLSICRNAGESSSHAGKRKISWQDPVALRV